MDKAPSFRLNAHEEKIAGQYQDDHNEDLPEKFGKGLGCSLVGGKIVQHKEK